MTQAKYNGERYDYIGNWQTYRVYGKTNHPDELLITLPMTEGKQKIIDHFVSKRTREYIEQGGK